MLRLAGFLTSESHHASRPRFPSTMQPAWPAPTAAAHGAQARACVRVTATPQADQAREGALRTVVSEFVDDRLVDRIFLVHVDHDQFPRLICRTLEDGSAVGILAPRDEEDDMVVVGDTDSALMCGIFKKIPARFAKRLQGAAAGRLVVLDVVGALDRRGPEIDRVPGPRFDCAGSVANLRTIGEAWMEVPAFK